MFGVNEYYDDLLLEAKSPEEIKKILEYQFVEGKGVPQGILNAVFNIDPTKKKSYTRWVLSLYDKDKDKISEAIINGTLKKLFKYFQSRANTGLNLTSIDSFDKALEMMPYEDHVLAKEGNGGPEDDYDIMFESNEWVIAVPHTYEADKKLGRGCRWCTAGAFGDSDHYWKEYSQYGPLWVNFDKRKSEICPMDKKEYPYTRYQLLFEYQGWHGELMDSNDNRIDFENVDMPEDVIEFYGEQNERYKDIIENGPAQCEEEMWEEYEEARINHSLCVLSYDDEYLSLMPERKQEPDMDFENCDYYLYDENQDTSDPISYDRFNPSDNYIVKSYEGYPIVFLKPVGYSENEVLVAAFETSNNTWRSGNFNLHSKIKKYGEVGEYVYFVHHKLFFLYSKNGCISDIELSTYSDEIENIFSSTMDTSDVEGYQRGIWVEIVDIDGFHSLIYFDTVNDNTIIVIKKDIPSNGKYYELSYTKNDYVFIQGKYSKHWLGVEGDDSDEQSFNIHDRILDTNLFIVDMGHDNIGNNMFNIFDSNNNKLILEKPFNDYSTYIDRYGVAELLTNEKSPYYLLSFKDTDENLLRVFDIYNLSFVTPLCEDIHRYDNIFVCRNPIGREMGTYFFVEKNGLVEYSGVRCENIMRRLCGPYFLFKNGGEQHVINAENGKITLPQDVVSTGELKSTGTDIKHPYILCKIGVNETIDLINFETNKTIVSGLVCQRPTILIDTPEYFAIIVHFPNGKYNVVYKDALILPENVDNIKVFPSETYYYHKVFSFMKSDIIYFINLDNLKITPNGGIFRHSIGMVGGANGNYEMKCRMGEKDIDFLYNAEEDEITRIVPDTPENLKFANSIVHKQVSQISETFKKTYKKIIDIDKKLWK